MPYAIFIAHALFIGIQNIVWPSGHQHMQDQRAACDMTIVLKF